MSVILKGKIEKTDTNEINVYYWDHKLTKDPEYSGEIYKILNQSDLPEFKNGDFVEFTLQKRFHSDKIELFARIYRIIENDWNQIFDKFEKSTEITDYSEFKKFISENYETPKKKIK